MSSVHDVFDTRIFHKEAKTLKKAGYDVTLIAQHTKKEVINGIEIIPIDESNNRYKRFIKTVWEVLKKSFQVKGDIYHFHDPELIPIGLLLKLNGMKVIYDVHEDVPKQIVSKEWIWKPIRGFVSKLASGMEKLADKFFNAIVSATPTIEKKFNNKNSIAVQNFPLLDELHISNSSENNKKKNIVTYVGSITKSRGIKEMVKAIDILSEDYDAKFLLAGKFTSKHLKDKTKKINGWSKVEFQGWIDRKQVASNLSQAKAGLVVLHPKHRYKVSYPIKMFEYMTAGLPVIASDFPLWEEIIEGNECGITVDPLDPKEIAEAIQYIFNHSEEAKRMGQNGRKIVEYKYNWSVEEKKLLNLYENILN